MDQEQKSPNDNVDLSNFFDKAPTSPTPSQAGTEQKQRASQIAPPLRLKLGIQFYGIRQNRKLLLLVVLGFLIIIFVAVTFLGSGSGNRPFIAPPGTKIIYPKGSPPRLDHPVVP